MDKSIIVAGDWHGFWSPVNFLINKKNPKTILQVGDFGWWPGFHDTHMVSSGEYEDISGEIIGDPWQRSIARRVEKRWNQFGLKNKDTKIYFCDGNHEDHGDLVNERNYMKAPCEMMPKVYYMKRGSTLKLKDGRTVLFMGGADSIDKRSRHIGYDWFPEELITQRDIYDLPDVNVDIVISHTCPDELYVEMMARRAKTWDKERLQWKLEDPSRVALSYVLEKYKPALWYFGHFHIFVRGEFNGTTWCCLNTIGDTGWWTYLDSKS